MAGKRQGVFVGAVLLAAAVLRRRRLAETIPLPTPAPRPKEGALPAIGDQAGRRSPARSAIAAPSVRPLFNLDQQPAAPPPAAATATTAAFDANQRALVDRVSAYLSSVQTLVGNFVQVGPDGSRAEGQFYMQKPGKVRFEYDPPSPIEIIADGQSVVVRDRKLATQDLYPLSQTPLRFLLADRIDLLRDTNVVGVSPTTCSSPW